MQKVCLCYKTMKKQIDWDALGFHYTETDFIIRADYKDGQWSKPIATAEKYIPLHVAATVLNYGQEAFEGVKAIRGVDNKIRIFRMHDHALRLQSSAKAIAMPPVPTELFCECIELALQKNIDFVPPHDSLASLYFRPLLFGTSPRLGVGPGDEYSFVIFASPIGNYFKGGFHPTTFVINRHVDRAATLGVGAYKVGGNYAAGFRATQETHQQGYGCLFTDALTHQYIDECEAANFLAIKGNQYLTPDSHSILPSVTNKSLMQLAQDMGLEVKCTPILVTDLATMDEAAACGTATIIAPIGTIIDPDHNLTYSFAKHTVCAQLYHDLLAIQHGEKEDKHGWCTIV